MANLERIGLMITIVMMLTGIIMAGLAEAEPNLGFSENLRVIQVTGEDINAVANNLNLDTNSGFSISAGITQIPLGAFSFIAATFNMLGLIATAFFGWAAVVDLMLAFGQGDFVIAAVSLGIKSVIGFIMIFTLITLIGNFIKSLPFFGGR